MANQFDTVANIIADVRDQADITGQDDRYSDAQMLRYFNKSVQRFQTMHLNAGFEEFQNATDVASLNTTPTTSGETFIQVAWPKDVGRIRGLHVLFETDLWIPLHPCSLNGLRDHQRKLWKGDVWSDFGGRNGPRVFVPFRAPYGVTTTETQGIILVAPIPTTALSYRLFYQENWIPLTNTTDVFNGQEGWIDWIIWDMVGRIVLKENDSRGTYAGAVRERDELTQMFANSAPRTQDSEAEEPRRSDDEDMW